LVILPKAELEALERGFGCIYEGFAEGFETFVSAYSVLFW